MSSQLETFQVMIPMVLDGGLWSTTRRVWDEIEIVSIFAEKKVENLDASSWMLLLTGR